MDPTDSEGSYDSTGLGNPPPDRRGVVSEESHESSELDTPTARHRPRRIRKRSAHPKRAGTLRPSRRRSPSSSSQGDGKFSSTTNTRRRGTQRGRSTRSPKRGANGKGLPTKAAWASAPEEGRPVVLKEIKSSDSRIEARHTLWFKTLNKRDNNYVISAPEPPPGARLGPPVQRQRGQYFHFDKKGRTTPSKSKKSEK